MNNDYNNQQPQQPQYQPPMPPVQPGKNLAVASLVMGICSLVFCQTISNPNTPYYIFVDGVFGIVVTR